MGNDDHSFHMGVMPFLETLNLTGCGLLPEALKEINASTLPNLQELSLLNNLRLGGNPFETYFHPPTKLQSLIVSNLSERDETAIRKRCKAKGFVVVQQMNSDGRFYGRERYSER